VAALGKQPDRAAELLLRTALADPEASVRSAALYALDRRGTSWHSAAIMLLTDPASNVRMTAILVLDHSGALAEDHLIGRAADPDTGIRRQALWLLSQWESPRTADIARPLLTDPDPSVRLGALHALHRTSLLTPADVATLSRDPDDRVRAAARAAVRAARGPYPPGLSRCD
jgi:HEAT repeat protein